ncbi:hypothetical protein [Algiphilus sp.]|uniref:hypothetical protein n=1 Tax=Algiphilus sp. TaxID=1872431 RepID=UPI003B515B43
MPYRFLTALLTAASVSFTAPALAGGSATIASQDQSMSLEYDGDRVRMNVQGEADTYMVIRDGRMYSVAGGMVFDASSLMRSFAGQAPAPGDDVGDFHGLKATGRSETVAGIPGEVYVIDFTDSEGRRQQKEAVLSRDKRAREMQQAFMHMTQVMAEATNTNTSGAAEMDAALDGRGILRMGNEMRVTAISGSTPPAARFELPSEPQQLGGGGSEGEGGIGAAISGFFGEKAERQQDRAADRTEQEIDEQTDKAADSLMDKAFDKLFGN